MRWQSRGFSSLLVLRQFGVSGPLKSFPGCGDGAEDPETLTNLSRLGFVLKRQMLDEAFSDRG